MPLREIGPHREWLDRERPSATARLVAAELMAQLGEEPWKAPSVPEEALCERPVSEYRWGRWPVPGEPAVEIHYRHYFDDKMVDLVEITQG